MRDVFLKGKTVCLCVPDIEIDVVQGNWHTWFNNEKINKYLYHGVYPNTREKQVEFVTAALKSKDTVMLTIFDNEMELMLGVISINRINLLNRSAEIAIVMGDVKYDHRAPLEAMALMTQYGFDKLNLNRIYAGQHVGLWKWVNTLELIGYKLEGYAKETHARYGTISDSVFTSIIARDFYELLEKRGGNYCTDDIQELLFSRRKGNMVERVKKLVDELYAVDE